MCQYDSFGVKHPLKDVYITLLMTPHNLRCNICLEFNKYWLNHFATAILSSSIVIQRIVFSYPTSEFDGKSLMQLVHKSMYT